MVHLGRDQLHYYHQARLPAKTLVAIRILILLLAREAGCDMSHPASLANNSQTLPPCANLSTMFLEVMPGRALHPGSHIAVPLLRPQRGQQAEQLIMGRLEKTDRLLQREGL